jgi:Sensors of blue-light using FAD
MDRLVYASISQSAIDPTWLDDMLVVARRRNLQDGLTGVLLCGERVFVQMLEGPAPAVAACFDRIAKDARHHSLVELSFEHNAVGPRLYPEWSMALATPHDIRAVLAQSVLGQQSQDSGVVVALQAMLNAVGSDLALNTTRGG